MTEIKVPSFINYTDHRTKKEDSKISGIEKDSIMSFAKDLSEEEMSLVLAQIPTEILLAHLSYRVLNTECKLNSLQRKVLSTLEV